VDRRNFFKILSTSSAGLVAGGCSTSSDALIPLLVPDSEIVPGEEQWHPAVCAECSAGCGTIVRIMEGVRVISQNGEAVRQRVAAIKKIEGNPLDPVSGGGLCARGQAAVQSLYHPDRVRGPMKRNGDRGKAQFAGISWDEAMASASEKIAKADPARVVFLTGPVAGTRSLAVERFTKAIGAPAPIVCSLADHATERKAADAVFGWRGLPVYDLAHTRHVLSVNADFLGGWASPVYYSRQYGSFRQGRNGVRGRLVHAESRLSLTAGAADRWLPLRPGTEPQFLAAVGRILLDAGRKPAQLPKGIAEVFQSAEAAALLAACGLEERRVREEIRELAESEAPLIVAGASIAHRNSYDAIVASHYLNLLLGNVAKPGGMLPPSPETTPGPNANLSEALAQAQVILIDGANPAYSTAPASGALKALERADSVINFAGFIDDSAAWSDLVLPAHHVLESEVAVVPVVAGQSGFNAAAPFVRPLYDTRPFEKIAADLTKTPQVTSKDIAGDASLEEVFRQGGLWQESKPDTVLKPAGASFSVAPAIFDGDAGQFPLLFQAYLGVQYGDGNGANLPWLQELPDPTSSSIWGLPVEIDPKAAAAMRIANGDVVRVESLYGSLEAPAYVHPGAVPGVVSMAVGDGHSHYGRYASGRGANPISILGPQGRATRVRMSRVSGRRDWIQFAAPDREEREVSHR
jgi:anaerobic selenocysteine-containing dehydrogenase